MLLPSLRIPVDVGHDYGETENATHIRTESRPTSPESVAHFNGIRTSPDGKESKRAFLSLFLLIDFRGMSACAQNSLRIQRAKPRRQMPPNLINHDNTVALKPEVMPEGRLGRLPCSCRRSGVNWHRSGKEVCVNRSWYNRGLAQDCDAHTVERQKVAATIFTTTEALVIALRTVPGAESPKFERHQRKRTIASA